MELKKILDKLRPFEKSCFTNIIDTIISKNRVLLTNRKTT
jgi:hypothetical protein